MYLTLPRRVLKTFVVFCVFGVILYFCDSHFTSSWNQTDVPDSDVRDGFIDGKFHENRALRYELNTLVQQNHTLQATIYISYETIAMSLILIKQTRYRPGQAQRLPWGWGFQISRQSANEGGKVVSPTHRPPLPQEIFLVLISVRAESTPGSQCGRKDYVNEKFHWHNGNRTRDLPTHLILQTENNTWFKVTGHSFEFRGNYWVLENRR